ncbi:NAD(P)-binding protein [Exidia glandulosa HHB12029]|uniref:NAD(P)-binding protein n=1 Tax=Exidia glandulosa HHB12029 TaxID=1314781 RepID=A0A165IXI3_EXIGL|nr:NAD(P)-binding protein [Exidia glandulosa HHB12029]
MTLSSQPSAPLVVVVGATGFQGGSVVRELIASDKPYRLRGLTRDDTKPAAQAMMELGVEVVAVTISVGNEAAVLRAFHGADIVFSVTNFWEHLDVSRELAEGKLMVDAAKAVGAKLFVFSGALSVTENSGGKYTHIIQWDSKAEIAAYAQSQLPTVNCQAGYYTINLANPYVGPRRLEDGSYVWEQPDLNDQLYPYIDTGYDYGLWVRYAIESPEYNKGGGTILTWGELLRPSEVAAILERTRGIKIKVTTWADRETQRKYLESLGAPPHVVLDVIEHAFMSEFGYYFGQERSEEQQKIRAALARKPRTLEEFLKANPEFFKQ